MTSLGGASRCFALWASLASLGHALASFGLVVSRVALLHFVLFGSAGPRVVSHGVAWFPLGSMCVCVGLAEPGNALVERAAQNASVLGH